MTDYNIMLNSTCSLFEDYNTLEITFIINMGYQIVLQIGKTHNKNSFQSQNCRVEK